MSAPHTLRRLSPFLVLLALRPLHAAPAANPVHQGFEGSTQIVAVEVPVNVVDRDGQPVRGLAAADFELYDEGRLQKVHGFEVVDLELLAAGDRTAAGERDRLERLDSPARRHFLLLFDLSFSSPTSILKARLAAREFLLHSLHPSDLVAVATFSLETGPRLVVTFTPDRAQLAQAIDTLGMHRFFAGERDPLRFLLVPPRSPAVESSGADQGSLPNLRNDAEGAILEYLTAITKAAEKNQKQFERSRISSMTRSLADMARSLDSVKGRKHVVLFSEGFDSRLMLGRENVGGAEDQEDNANILSGRHDLTDSDDRWGNTGLQGDVNRMIEQFRRADCVIQAVDIGGLRTSADASEGARRSGDDALFYIANETGGELFKDTNDLGGQLARVLRRSSVTYLLTFERADLKPDGSYHRLRVKAKLPPGARLSHRSGYYAPRPFRDLDPLEKNLLAADGIASAAPRRELAVSVLAAPFRASQDFAYVPVIVEVGGESLLAGQKSDKLNAEIYAYVSDERGEMRDFFTRAVALDMTKGRRAIADTGVKYYGHFDLPPGRYRVRVLVRNGETGRTGVESLALDVPTYRAAAPQLLPPLFFEPPGRWLLVRERGADEQQGSVVYPFTVNGEPYVPAARPRLSRREAARLCLVGYNLGAGDLQVVGEVVAADGRTLPGGRLAVVERTATGQPGVDKLLATFQPTDLAAGEYVLKVGIVDPATGRRESNSVPFVVN
jgi:VWFA-related protein